MRKYRVVIIDDEYPGRLMIRQLTSKHPQLEVVGEAVNGQEAIQLINVQRPDLIFLDIQLHDMTGFDVLESVGVQPFVIFTTAYDQFALKSFEQNTIDYLLKPIDEERFAQAVKKLETNRVFFSDELVNQMRMLFNNHQPKKKLSAIPIYQGDKISLFKLTDLYIASSENGYVVLQDGNGGKQLTERSLLDLEELLPGNFLRIQKSYIINKDKVKEIHRHFNSRFVVVMDDKNQTRLLSGKSYANALRNAFDLR